MKTNLFIAIAFVVSIASVNAQIKVNSSGYVGIGAATTPLSTFHVKGASTDLFRVESTTNEADIRYIGGTNTNWQVGADNTNGGFFFYNDYSGSGNYRMFISNSGNVGIGYGATAPSQKFSVNGSTYFSCNSSNGGIYFENYQGSNIPVIRPLTNNVAYLGVPGNYFLGTYSYNLYYYNAYNQSDQRLKTNIVQLTSAMERIKKMNPVSYEWILDSLNFPADIKQNYDTKKLKKIGFLAQEMQTIVPEAVNYDENSKKYGIDYSCLIPVLVQAMKEQNKTMDTLKQQNEFMQQQVKSCCDKNQLKSMTALSEEIANSNAVLYQNMPNPFSEKTEIKYILPENTQSAMICVYDMQGKQLKCYNVAGQGENSITINGSDLTAGMYLYTLIVNGKEVDTKRMILTN